MQKVATSPDQLFSQEDLLSQSGFDAMTQMLQGDASGPPIAALLNFRLSKVEDGLVAFEGEPPFEASNPMGTVHGGWYGTVLDSCMACAVMTQVPKGSVYTTLEYKINILRPTPVGTKVRAVGKTQHVGRSTGIANGEIRGRDDDRLYATGSTTCIVMKIR
ncbi:MAG: PaaI family thioesterase [Thalassovita sp.]